MKKVLIITYYWPPAGGGGVMRWAKMSRYLKENTDWEPIIFTAAEAGYLIQDSSLGNDTIDNLKVIRQKIIEPNNLLKKLGFKSMMKNVSSGGVGKSTSKKSSFKSNLIIWIRSNLFIPDARFLWIKPSIRRILKELKSEQIDAIISTGPPHSVHLIGMKVHQISNIPWIADFRDPWTEIDFFKDLKLTQYARNKHFELERKVIESASGLVTIGQNMADQFYDMYQRKFEIITNGFDPMDFENILPYKRSEKFTISHIGSLNKDRNLPVFWNAIADLCNKNLNFSNDLVINLIGSITDDLLEELKSLRLEKKVNIISHMAHIEAINYEVQSDLLLLLINNTPNQKGILPGKFFEYLAARRPILCIGNKEGDVAEAIRKTESGKVFAYNDKEQIIEYIENIYNLEDRTEIVSNKSDKTNKYSRKNLAIDYSKILDRMVEEKAKS